MSPYFTANTEDFTLYRGDCVEVMNQLEQRFDMIFADPPYFLSNGGISYQSGQVVSVNKGEWDKSRGREADNDFNRQWLTAARRVLKDNGTIWISGTYHNIFSIAHNLTELGYKILNVITWQKTNPPPNISCRYFTFSTEFVIWARKCQKVPHYFNYELMKRMNGDTQMTDVWRIPAIAPWEKRFGKHPTQKPLKLLHRIVLASTRPGDLVLDPFSGSATTGIAANLLDRRYVGIDLEQDFLDISIKRKEEIGDPASRALILKRLADNPDESTVLVNHARSATRERMIEKGICYLRAGDTQGSLLVKPGFERLNYVLLHTGGEQPRLFPLRQRGKFQIWNADTLRQHGFEAEHAPYYIVLHFDPAKELTIDRPADLHRSRATYVATLRPLSDFIFLSE